MDKFITTGNGGNPIVLDDVRFFLGQIVSGNHGIYQALNNMLRGYGDNFIVQGVVASGVTPNIAITEGWIMLAGELLKVDAQTGIDTTSEDSFTKVSTFNAAGNKTFRNGAIIDTYEQNRGVVNSLAGTLDFDGNTFADLRNFADKGAGIVTMKKKIIEIGDWDMDTLPSISKAHGLTAVQAQNIREITIMIQDDAATLMHPIGVTATSLPQGGITLITSTAVFFERLTGGVFDNTTFNLTPFNRGWITIEYEG